jgi:cytoskeletal protein RodZ
MTGEPATPQLSAGSNRSKTQTSSGDPWFKVGTFVLFLVLMILMTLWKLYPNNTEDSLPEPAHLLPPTPELPMNNSTQLPASNATPLPSQPIPMSSQPLSQQASGSGGTETSNNAGSDIVYTPPTEEENAEITTTVISAEAPAATEEAETAATGNNAATVNRFSLVVSADAWMQINDKEGKPIFLGTAKPSQTIELKGTPPFQVRVGNIDGVNVKHNGSVKPLSDFPREGRRVYIVGQPAE